MLTSPSEAMQQLSDVEKLALFAMAQQVVWVPDYRNQPQVDAYLSQADELLFGGAAGGGKSDLLLGLARTQHRRSLLLRREFPDLERSLITRSLEFFGPRRAYNAGKHAWEIDGRRIEFGHMERIGSPQVPGDEAQYAGAPYDLIGFDQLEQFPSYAYDFMGSRNRTSTLGQRCRRVATANPVGPYLYWIVAHWAPWLDENHPNKARFGELRWFVKTSRGKDREVPDGRPVEDSDTGESLQPLSRTFIPARLVDNPYLDQGYLSKLQSLPEPLRSALLHGEFSLMLEDDPWQLIKREWVKLAQERWFTVKEPDGPVVLGVDVARGGDDETVLAPRKGSWVGPLQKYPGRSTPDGQTVAGLVLMALGPEGRANVDVIGVGSSVYDQLKGNERVLAVNSSERSPMLDRTNTMRMTNVRAEVWWRLREWLDPVNGYEPALPPDQELAADLLAPRWSMTTSGIQVEAKEAIKSRLGRSPNSGDALAYSMYERIQPAAEVGISPISGYRG